MAGPGSINSRVTKHEVKDPRALKAFDAEQEVLDALGLDEQALGPNAKKELEKIHRDFIRLAGSGRNAINTPALEKAALRLGEAAAKDDAAQFKAPTAPHADTVRNWGKTTQVREHNGTLALTGTASGESHPLARLLGTLGVNPQSLTPNVADVLADAVGRNLDLSSQKNFNALARNVLMAKAKDGGATRPATTVASAEKVVSTPQVTGPVPKAPIDGAVTRNPELEAVAPDTIGAGNRNNAIALLAQNMGANGAQDKGRKGAVADLAKAIAADAGIEKPTTKQLKEIKAILDTAMTDRTSPDGSVRPTAVMMNAYDQLDMLEREQLGHASTYGMAKTMAAFMHEAAKQEETLPPDVEKVFNELAAASLADLVGVKVAGKPIDASAGMMDSLRSAMASLKGKGAAEPTPEAEKVAPKDGAKTEDASQAQPATGPAKPISPRVQQLAADTMRAMGIEPDLPSAAPVKKAFEEIISRGESPEEVAVNTAKWLDQLCGTNHAAQTAQILAQNPDPDLASTMSTKGLQSVAMAAVNPEQFKLQAQQQAAAAAASGNSGAGGAGVPGGVPGGFGMPGVMGLGSPADADGSKNQVYLQRTIVINSILNDPSLSIEDKIFYFMMWFAAFADKEREQKMREIADLDRVDQQKKMMKDGVHRERQALFQTRKEITRGIDQAEGEALKANPHMEKLEAAEKRLSRLERKPDAKPADLEKAKKAVVGLRAAAGVDTPQHQALRDAHEDLSALVKKGDAKPEQIEAAQKKVAEARAEIPLTKADEAMQKVASLKAQLADANRKIDQKSEEFDKLKNETAQAPKSRELLFMELERIQRFRGMLIDMANSFLRDMARRVKEIMQ